MQQPFLHECEKKGVCCLSLAIPFTLFLHKIARSLQFCSIIKDIYRRSFGRLGSLDQGDVRLMEEEWLKTLAGCWQYRGFHTSAVLRKGLTAMGKLLVLVKEVIRLVFLQGVWMFVILLNNRALPKALNNGRNFSFKQPPGTQPYPKQFLQRNAFISAWSTELVVVEAGDKKRRPLDCRFCFKTGKARLLCAAPD